MSADRWGAQRWTGTRPATVDRRPAQRLLPVRPTHPCTTTHPRNQRSPFPLALSSTGVFAIPLGGHGRVDAVLLAAAQNCRVGEAERTCGAGQRPRQCSADGRPRELQWCRRAPRRTTMRAAGCEWASCREPTGTRRGGYKRLAAQVGVSGPRFAVGRGSPGTESCLCPGDPRTAFPALKATAFPGTEARGHPRH